MDEVSRDLRTTATPAGNETMTSASMTATILTTALGEIRREQADLVAPLVAEIARLRKHVSDLSIALESIQQQLTVLDRDNLRSEERDRELLEALRESRQRDITILAAIRGGTAATFPPLESRVTRRTRSCDCRC